MPCMTPSRHCDVVCTHMRSDSSSSSSSKPSGSTYTVRVCTRAVEVQPTLSSMTVATALPSTCCAAMLRASPGDGGDGEDESDAVVARLCRGGSNGYSSNSDSGSDRDVHACVLVRARTSPAAMVVLGAVHTQRSGHSATTTSTTTTTQTSSVSPPSLHAQQQQQQRQLPRQPSSSCADVADAAAPRRHYRSTHYGCRFASPPLTPQSPTPSMSRSSSSNTPRGDCCGRDGNSQDTVTTSTDSVVATPTMTTATSAAAAVSDTAAPLPATTSATTLTGLSSSKNSSSSNNSNNDNNNSCHGASASAGGSGVHSKGKVPRMPGYSMLDWTRRLAATTTTSGRSASQLPRVSAATVARHASKDDAWLIVDDVVYDVTPFLHYHPGGSSTLLRYAGADATRAFYAAHRWVSCSAMLRPFIVGLLDKSSNSNNGSSGDGESNSGSNGNDKL